MILKRHLELKSKRAVLTLRLMLILATALLLIPPGSTGRVPPFETLLLGLFLLSNAALLAIPESLLFQHRYELLLVVFDTFLVSLGLFQTSRGNPDLLMVFFLILLLSALGRDLAAIVAGSTAVAGFYLFLTHLAGLSAGMSPGQSLLRLPFLYVSALYYGAAVIRVRTEQDRTTRLENERKDLETFLEITAATNSSLDLRTVLNAIVQRIARMVDAIRCSIILVDPPGEQGTVLATSEDSDLKLIRIDLKKYPELCRATETRKPVIINDVDHAPMMRNVREFLKQKNINSLMVAPLMFEEDLLGMLFVQAASTQRWFSSNEIKAFQVVANASTNALKNAMLFEQVREEVKRRTETSEVLRNIMEHFPDMIFTADLRGTLTDINRGGEAMLGIQREELIGTPAEKLFPGGMISLAPDNLSRQGGFLSNCEVTLKRANGEMRHGIATVALLRSEANEPIGMLGICKDITVLKETREQLYQAEKMSTLGVMVSGLAHELKNPLAGVLGYSQLLMAENRDPKIQGRADRIFNSALRCQKIVQNLLSFTRKQPFELKYLGVNGIIEKTRDMTEYQLRVSNIRMHCDLLPNLPKTLVDFHKMQQVFLNIINNSQQAISSSNGGGGIIHVKTFQRGGRIIITFEDNGPGIPHDKATRIFDPFFTTKRLGEGTGLGLSISYGIIREHGGRIHAESKEKKGARIVIELPIRKPEGKTMASTAIRTSKPVPGKRILIIDDEPTFLDLMLDTLEPVGYRVDTANNGREALKKIEKNPYDAIILDLRMPDMDGKHLYRLVNEKRPRVARRIIFNSGDMMDPETKAFIDSARNPILEKPFRLEELHNAIASLLADPARN